MSTAIRDSKETGNLPGFLVAERVIREDGAAPELDLGCVAGSVIQLTLGVTRIIEQESLEISIWGSADRTDWGAKPLLSFPQKFYCGTYSIVLDLSRQPDVRYLSARWKVNRWGRGETKPLFGFFVFAEELAAGTMAASQ